MNITYQCGHCGRTVSAPDRLAGQPWRCPHTSCSVRIWVPRWGEGMTIAARWRVRKILEGGMGWVYVAQDMKAFQDGRFYQVALKSFKEVSNPVRVRKFLTEARRWIHLGQHAHIVTALFAQEMEGWPLLELEYVHGNTLKHWIDRRRLSLPQAVNFAIQLCEGMQYMNVEAGMVHRDLKPSNLLIDDLNVLKITDVGISRTASALPATSDPAEPEDIAGTPLYMSPEQFDYPAVDCRSDIYSAGIILYEMLTGRRPFSGPSYTALRELHKNQLPLPPVAVNPDLPDALTEITMRCLAKSPDDRIVSFQDLRQKLEEINERLIRRAPFVNPHPVELPQQVKLLQQCYSMLTLKRFEEARRIGEQLIQLDPQNAEGWNNVGVALTYLGKDEESCRYLEKAVALNPEYVAAMTNLGSNLTKLERHAEGRQWLEAATRIDPGYAEAWANLGVNFARTNSAQAFECFDRAVQADPNYWLVWLVRGFTCLDLDRAQEALDCCERAERFLVRDGRLWELKTRALIELGDTNRALDVCDEALSFEPDTVMLWLGKIAVLGAMKADKAELTCIDEALTRLPDESRLHFVRGLWFSHRDQPAEAEKSYSRVCDLDPSNARAFRFRGEELIDLERFEEATLCYETATQLEPGNHFNWQGLGVSRLKSRRYAAALPALEKAAELDTENAATRHALEVCRDYLNGAKSECKRTAFEEGLELCVRGQAEQAIEKLNQAIAENPNNPEALQLRGSSLAQLGRSDEALADLSRALELNPRDSLARAHRAHLLYVLGRSGEALGEAKRAVGDDPDQFYPYSILGEVAQSRSEFEPAAKAYLAAIESLRKTAGGSKPEKDFKFIILLTTLHRNRGICLKQLGEFDAALNHFTEALKLNPADEQTRKELRDFE